MARVAPRWPRPPGVESGASVSEFVKRVADRLDLVHVEAVEARGSARFRDHVEAVVLAFDELGCQVGNAGLVIDVEEPGWPQSLLNRPQWGWENCSTPVNSLRAMKIVAATNDGH